MMKAKGRCRTWQTLVATFLLCSLALSLACLSLYRVTKENGQTEDTSEAEASEVMKGSIFFKEEEIEFQSASGSATEDDGLLPIALGQADLGGMDIDSVKEVRWKDLNTSLHCGQNNMTLRVDGPGAVKLLLDSNDGARPLPVLQVPESCGFSLRQNRSGFTLVVQYDGCNVRQENGRYVLPLRWQKTTVKITCAMWSEATVLTTPVPELPSKAPSPHRRWWLHRSKRDLKWPVYHYCYPYYLHPYYRSAYVPHAPTTTAPPPTVKPLVNLDLWRNLIELYPVYSRYFDKNQIPLNALLNLYKQPEWQLLPKVSGNSRVSKPVRHSLNYYSQSQLDPPTPSSPKPQMTKPSKLKMSLSGSGYPGLQRELEQLYQTPLIQSILVKDDKVHGKDYKPRTQTLIDSYQQFLASLSKR